MAGHWGRSDKGKTTKNPLHLPAIFFLKIKILFNLKHCFIYYNVKTIFLK